MLGEEPAGGGGGEGGGGPVRPHEGEGGLQADPHRQVTLLHAGHQSLPVHQHRAPSRMF